MLNLFQVFVACVTEKYSKSKNCRKEVSLADSLEKTIVPLLREGTWPVEGPMAVNFTRLIYVNCKEGLTDEKLSEVVENIKANTH